MSEVQVQSAPTELKHLQPDAALAITRSLHADLDLSGIVKRLYTLTAGLTSIMHMRYANENPAVCFEHGRELEHSISYELKLTSQVDSAGSITLSGPTHISLSDQEMIEELLSLAANALRNAHRHYKISEAVADALHSSHPSGDPANGTGEVEVTDERKSKEEKYPDALVLIRIDGLAQLRHSDDDGDALAEKIMLELKAQLGHALRGADGTMQVDQDHLAVLLPCTATLGANRVAEKVTSLMEKLDFIDPAIRKRLAVSFGISSTKEAGSAEAVLASAKVQLSQNESSVPTDQVVH